MPGAPITSDPSGIILFSVISALAPIIEFFPNYALVKNDLHIAAKRKFIDKDPNASDWYVISPAELVTARYGQRGTTATPFAERTKDMKGIGQYEFYGGPNVTDPNGKHYTSVLEASLRRAAKVNNAEFKVVKVQISEAYF